MPDLWPLVEKKLEEQTGSFSKSTSYLEYYSDIIAIILRDIIRVIDPTLINPELQTKIDILDQILTHASIDMDNLSSPLENYKVNGIVNLKEVNAELRKMYMNAIMNGK